MIPSKFHLVFFCLFLVIISSTAKPINEENEFVDKDFSGRTFNPSADKSREFPTSIFLNRKTFGNGNDKFRRNVAGQSKTFGVTDLGHTGDVRQETLRGNNVNINLVSPKTQPDSDNFATGFVQTTFGRLPQVGSASHNNALNSVFNSSNPQPKNTRPQINGKNQGFERAPNSFASGNNFFELNNSFADNFSNFGAKKPSNNIVLVHTEDILDDGGSESLENGVFANNQRENFLDNSFINSNDLPQSFTLNEFVNNLSDGFSQSQNRQTDGLKSDEFYRENSSIDENQNSVSGNELFVTTFPQEVPVTTNPFIDETIQDKLNSLASVKISPINRQTHISQVKPRHQTSLNSNQFSQPFNLNINPSPKDNGQTSFIQRLKPKLVLNNVTPNYAQNDLFFGQTLPLEDVTESSSFLHQNKDQDFQLQGSNTRALLENAILNTVHTPKFHVIPGTKDETLNFKLNNPGSLDPNFSSSNSGVSFKTPKAKITPKGRSLSGFDSIPPHQDKGFAPGKLEGGFVPSNYFKALRK